MNEDRLLKLCRDFIRIDSTNTTGTVPLARRVQKELKKLGFEVSLQRARLCGAPQVNVIARQGPRHGKALLINTHLDTVTTTASLWTATDGNPFRATIRKGRLYGLGAADTKLALACQICALESLDLDRLKIPLMLTTTYGEEMGLIGIQKLIRHRAVKPRYVLNSEPTELRPSHGNFGFRIYRLVGQSNESLRMSGYLHSIEFLGQAAHSAVPHLGKNAIEQALAWLRSERPDVQIVAMKGGIAANIVAPQCSLTVLSPRNKLASLRPFRGQRIDSRARMDCQIHPGLSQSLRALPRSMVTTVKKRETTNVGMIDLTGSQYEMVFSQRFAPGTSPNSALAHWNHQLKKMSHNKHMSSLSIENDNPALKQDGTRPFIRQIQSILRSLKKPAGLMLRPGCNEALYFARLGCDVLTIGPGEAYGNIHAPNESIRLKDLKEAVEFYRKVIQRICF